MPTHSSDSHAAAAASGSQATHRSGPTNHAAETSTRIAPHRLHGAPRQAANPRIATIQPDVRTVNASWTWNVANPIRTDATPSSARAAVAVTVPRVRGTGAGPRVIPRVP